MKEHIEKLEGYIEVLEKELQALKLAHETKEREEYEKQEHKTFNIGDWVVNGVKVGKVGWVENKEMGITEQMGYCGVFLRHGNGFLLAPSKRDEWSLIKGKELAYLNGTHKLEVELTGEQLQELKYLYQNGTQSEATKVFLEALKNTGSFKS
jgi:hypothetical protein